MRRGHTINGAATAYGTCVQNRRCFAAKFSTLLSLALLLSSRALGQDYQRLAPRTLPPATGSSTEPAPAPTVHIKPEDLRPILKRPNGIRLVAKAAWIQTNGFRVDGLMTAGLPLLRKPRIEARLRSFLGKPLTMAAMKEVAAVVEQWYRSQGRPFMKVAFPPQDISTGVLQGVVTEFRVGKIRTEGNKWFADWLLESQMSLQTGDLIRTETLNDDLAWLNQNPFRQTTAVAEKGDVAGTTDIVLHTDDRFPLRVYASYDNTGVPEEGINRWGIGILWGDAFFLDQLLAYQFTSSDDFWSRPDDISVSGHEATLAAHSVSWIVPLPWRDKLIFNGLYEQARPDLGAFLGEVGTSWQASGRYDRTLPPLWGMTQDLQFGFDFKRTNNDFAFGGYGISASVTDIAQFPILYALNETDRHGTTSFSNLVEMSPGRFDASNTDAAFQPSLSHFGVDYASARYAYDEPTLTRITRFRWDITGIDRVQGELATTNLLPSETLDDGGLDSVRGYEERTASGSMGILASHEFRTPAFSPTGQLSGALAGWDGGVDLADGDALQFDAFWDYGYVQDNRAAPGAPNGTSLMSVGCGAHYTLGRFIDFRVENGWQLERAPGARRTGSELIFSAVVGD
ncbi:MAG TPA: ShlB/FhaC/HecB family hemolysin secretion/activation protein [Rhizomicrobium sp.]|jgi:hemolysin activation/secretion protein|nr:ShlB/FhaC/HecB family hemolysin secretion/activation protein [Rhizomicrobium sp.]